MKPSAATDEPPREACDDVRAEGAEGAVVTELAEWRLHARAASGERDAIESVWRRNRRWIASVLAANAPRGVDVEDLLQEVAATFVVKAREIRDAASVRGWLRVVAVNAARMAARRHNAERRSFSRLAGSSGGSRGSGSDARACEEARETLALLSRLPAQYAEPLILQAGQGFSQKEIAKILGLPETTIETRLARGRRMLRRLAEEEACGDGGGAAEHLRGDAEFGSEVNAKADAIERSVRR